MKLFVYAKNSKPSEEHMKSLSRRKKIMENNNKNKRIPEDRQTTCLYDLYYLLILLPMTQVAH